MEPIKTLSILACTVATLACSASTTGPGTDGQDNGNGANGGAGNPANGAGGSQVSNTGGGGNGGNGGAGTGGAAVNGTGGAGANTGSDAAAGSGGSGNTTGTGGSGPSGPPQVVTLTMGAFDVAPGKEVYKCQNVANPFGGGDAEVVKWEGHMPAGSHHMLLFFRDANDNGPVEDCDKFEFALSPFGSQQPDSEATYPDGVAALISKARGFRFQAHYLNLTSATIHASVTVTATLAQPGTITAHAGVLSFVNTKINIPPQSTRTITGSCSMGASPIKLIDTVSHMHQHATHFVATAGNQTLFETDTWDEPATKYYPTPLDIAPNTTLTWSCTYNNTSMQTVTFGEHAASNEMCNFFGGFYPITGPEVVGCTLQ